MTLDHYDNRDVEDTAQPPEGVEGFENCAQVVPYGVLVDRQFWRFDFAHSIPPVAARNFLHEVLRPASSLRARVVSNVPCLTFVEVRCRCSELDLLEAHNDLLVAGRGRH